MSLSWVNDDSLLSIMFYVAELILELDVEPILIGHEGLYKNWNISKERAIVGGANYM